MSSDTGCTLPAGIVKKREALLCEIRDSVRRGGAALVLGAGVSRPAEMPMWQGLISRMLGYAIQYEQKRKHPNGPGAPNKDLLRLSAELISGSLELLGDVNPLESAEYVAQFFSADREETDPLTEEIRQLAIREMVEKILADALTPAELLEKEVRKADAGLRRELQQALKSVQVGKAPDRTLQKKLARRNTLFAAAWLMATEHGIPKAMSYNYDPLMQEQLTGIFGLNSGSLVTHPGLWNPNGPSRPEAREIFHVHGFIPGRRHPAGTQEQIYPSRSGTIILSEDSYYRMEREEAYNWSASVQSSFLNRYNCVFVGFSAEDFNFRRILRQIGSKKEEDKVHYLILTVDDLMKSIRKSVESGLPAGLYGKKRTSILDVDTGLLLEQILNSRGRYWDRFGIRPLFVTVEEIPDLLVDLAP